jgi:hypothetical protein
MFMAMVLLTTGCVKETYDMNKLSKDIQLSPTFALSVVKGDVSLSEIVKPSDTVVYDPDNFVRLVYEDTSVVDLDVNDFYDLSKVVSYNKSYTVGDLSIDPFQSEIDYTLNEISDGFAPALKALFVALDDGSAHPFPSFPSTNLGEKTFAAFPNFETALFKSGYIDISIINNLTAPLDQISLNLYNSVGHTPIGGAITIPAIQPGEVQTVSLDISGLTITNSIVAAIVLSGSPGKASPVLIDLDNSKIRVFATGRDLVVTSGRVILPAQSVGNYDKKDTIVFYPGTDIEIDELKITSGQLAYNIQSTIPVAVSLGFKLPDAIRSGIPVTETININASSTATGNFSVDNTLFKLGLDTERPFNRIPMENTVTVSSSGSMINFDSGDYINFDLQIADPVYDYVKGYFGQDTETVDPDSLDLEITDILQHVSGTYLIKEPSIKINYRNSFSVPVQLTLNVQGKRQAQTVNLGLAPINVDYPEAPTVKDITSSFIVDKNNSSLPALISLPPEIIRYSGSAITNPSGNDGLRNNYVYGNSRLHVGMEVEVPLNFRMNNLQFRDTVGNFLKDDSTRSDLLQADNFKLLKLVVAAKNGFPLGASLKLLLWDSATNTVLSTIEAKDLIAPAPVGTDGKANGTTETSTTVEFTSEFLSSVNSADKVIFEFTLNTTDNGTKDVKIYSDYRINFKAALVVKPNIIN